MKAMLLKNKREHFKGLLLELTDEESETFPKLPRVFGVGVEGWRNNSEFESTADIAEAVETPLSDNEASVFLTDIANDLTEFASSLPTQKNTIVFKRGNREQEAGGFIVFLSRFF